jgi:hypothetical protein
MNFKKILFLGICLSSLQALSSNEILDETKKLDSHSSPSPVAGEGAPSIATVLALEKSEALESYDSTFSFFPPETKSRRAF